MLSAMFKDGLPDVAASVLSSKLPFPAACAAAEAGTGAAEGPPAVMGTAIGGAARRAPLRCSSSWNSWSASMRANSSSCAICTCIAWRAPSSATTAPGTGAASGPAGRERQYESGRHAGQGPGHGERTCDGRAGRVADGEEGLDAAVDVVVVLLQDAADEVRWHAGEHVRQLRHPARERCRPPLLLLHPAHRRQHQRQRTQRAHDEPLGPNGPPEGWVPCRPTRAIGPCAQESPRTCSCALMLRMLRSVRTACAVSSHSWASCASEHTMRRFCWMETAGLCGLANVHRITNARGLVMSSRMPSSWSSGSTNAVRRAMVREGGPQR